MTLKLITAQIHNDYKSEQIIFPYLEILSSPHSNLVVRHVNDNKGKRGNGLKDLVAL